MNSVSTKPWNIAHRGGAGLRPENTLAAFAHALDLGVDGFELDVHVCKDGTVVVFHDDALKPEIVRGENGQWIEGPGPLIKDLTFAELQSYDIGRLKPGTKYAARQPNQTPHDGERIPRLADVIALINRSGGPERIWIELKTNFMDRSRTNAPEATAKTVLRVLRREKFIERAVLVSFDWPGLIAAKKIEPAVQCWFTTLPQSWFGDVPVPPADGPPPAAELERLRAFERSAAPWTGGFDRATYGSVIKAAKAAGADGWFPYFADITRASLKEAHELGLQVGAWTVNEADDLARLADWGVDGLCSDYPDRLSGVLKGL
ncbi:MAG: glycerophosphodiester phosphodiesterase [Alphaproteobacteria bacterium]|nr:glycerophosphodiester phosphodiesterase [Alphaproteobacteria bacterium]